MSSRITANVVQMRVQRRASFVLIRTYRREKIFNMKTKPRSYRIAPPLAEAFAAHCWRLNMKQEAVVEGLLAHAIMHCPSAAALGELVDLARQWAEANPPIADATAEAFAEPASPVVGLAGRVRARADKQGAPARRSGRAKGA